ncbi:hypothetical protein OHT52_06360 [Streptomyces sp. NBC_00247]|uniref:hypothetical protein n=1 Tax=Streptomyces sp. NBC_00247 TaxID=2975689 RepID=UPI002E2E57DD|nr:hypothetical protein [Streptomyces sp. NBC_00247]
MTVAIASVAAILIALKVALDQVSGLLDSASQTRAAWRRFRGKEGEPVVQDEPPAPDNEEEPPLAA